MAVGTAALVHERNVHHRFQHRSCCTSSRGHERLLNRQELAGAEGTAASVKNACKEFCEHRFRIAGWDGRAFSLSNVIDGSPILL